ncbi:hypothetical protein GPECTOR_31g395 [Gonium pectorale]|uniref:Uncharacterized protein n=1 Tax=Gonium pectorale TaxID=33097 RepID=A0A150GDV1_GONPE|nr:hypothetical protein GPECTOR_31g395 [Gonium pectorale]|eukprot:KXZ48031.1 hypothetical protein GPECTOR_31g395 [Gonium pectorale]
MVRDVLEAMGVETRVVPSLAFAAQMEGWHHGTFADWQMPTIVTGTMFMLLFIFSAIRYNHYDHTPWYQQALLHLTLSTYLFMPGYYSKLWTTSVVPALAFGPTAKVDKFGLAPAASVPAKAVTLLTSGGSATSAITSATAPSVLLKPVDAVALRSRPNWQGETSMLLGILAGVCATEAPIKWPTAKYAWPAGNPTITLLSTGPCVIIIAAKLILVAPPVAWALRKSRSGSWGRPTGLCAIYAKHG